KKEEEEKGSGGRKGRRGAGNGASRGYVDIFLEIAILEALIHSFFSEQHEVKTKISFADYKILGSFFPPMADNKNVGQIARHSYR
ncbi:MAG: hypothetical protein ACK5UE_06570, partial [Chitinophagales bacterium]